MGEHKTLKPYDAEKHCGAAVERNVDVLREKLEKSKRALEHYIDLSKERKLSILEATRFKKVSQRVRFRQIVIENAEARGPDNRPCVKSKGQGTDHPGVGFCQFHCVCKGRAGGHMSYYSRKARDTKLSDVIDELEQSAEDVLNLEPDVLLMRAKIKLFLDDRQDFEPETVRSLTLLADQLRKTVETINDKRFKASLSVETFQIIQYRMAEVLMKYVSDPEILDRIADDWKKIAVDNATTKNKLALSSGKVE